MPFYWLLNPSATITSLQYPLFLIFLSVLLLSTLSLNNSPIIYFFLISQSSRLPQITISLDQSLFWFTNMLFYYILNPSTTSPPYNIHFFCFPKESFFYITNLSNKHLPITATFLISQSALLLTSQQQSRQYNIYFSDFQKGRLLYS